MKIISETPMIRLARVPFVLLAVFLLAGGCTSDEPAPLGSEYVDDGLIHPDSIEVVQDTVAIGGGDTSFLVSNFLFRPTTMELGRKDGIESWPVFRIDFSTPEVDPGLTVRSASLQLAMIDTLYTLSLRAVFVQLADSLGQSDTLKTLVLADTIPDSTLTNVGRLMQYFPRTYSLPPRLVEDWIKGAAPHNGIAVVLDDPTETTRARFGTKENAEEFNQPILEVYFTSGDKVNYRPSVDGTFVRDLSTTENLLVSDGGDRRVYLPIDLGVFDPTTVIHEARLILHAVPDSYLEPEGLAARFTLYAPETADIRSPDILTGLPVSEGVVSGASDEVVIPVPNILSILLARGIENPPLVLRYSTVGSSIRRVQFYSSDAPDSLKPALAFTYSTAPKFGK